ncbi:hypothetical protein NE237_003187 [Protea cynaroides]|uniref:Protein DETOXIFICATION n=1 Tax=Protea cynaroides TaxID=273540 RepID=A0A9Q0KGC6_9MAGN|nr:hypothetical protein NE237_003187 [Protea cynaroides]
MSCHVVFSDSVFPLKLSKSVSSVSPLHSPFSDVATFERWVDSSSSPPISPVSGVSTVTSSPLTYPSVLHASVSSSSHSSVLLPCQYSDLSSVRPIFEELIKNVEPINTICSEGSALIDSTEILPSTDVVLGCDSSPIVAEKLEQKLDEQPPDLRNDKSVQDDVFLQVMGPERNGRVRGAGKAVAPSDVGLARSNVQKKKEDEELQATISNMQGEINDLKEQLTEMDQIKTQLTEMDQMKAQLKEMDQLKVQLTQMDQMKTQIAFLTQAFTGRNTSQSSIHLWPNICDVLRITLVKLLQFLVFNMCPLKESQAVLCGDHHPLASTDDERNEDNKNEEQDHSIIRAFLPSLPMSEIKEELISLVKIALPMLLTSLLLYSRSIISMLFLGYLGDIQLAGGSLSIGFANITGYSVIKGLAMGMEPICCQAYGAKRWNLLSQTFQKTFCLLLLVTIPISFLWLNMDHLLLWMGQDPAVTSMAKVYLIFSLPDLLAQAHLHPLRIFLRTQGLTTPLTLAAIFALILHLPINYLLVIYLNLGVKGVALGSACHSLNLNLGLLVYLVRSRKSLKPWSGASLTSWFQGWRPLLALAMPSAVSVCLEWWWYELMQLLCGLLINPQASVAAMGILIQTTSLIYVFPHSLSMALSTRVGHELGANKSARAQSAAIIGLSERAACGNMWGRMFTDKEQILALTSIALPILGLVSLGMLPAYCPRVGANINFGSFYLIGLPIAVLMSFGFKIGFLGLWFGLGAAEASCLSMMMYTLIRTDWKHQAKRAQELTRAAEGHLYDLETGLLSPRSVRI